MVSLFRSLSITFPFALSTFLGLSYSNVSASNTIPLSVVIVPLLVPLNLFPFSNISISVTSKLNCSTAYNEEECMLKKMSKINM